MMIHVIRSSADQPYTVYIKMGNFLGSVPRHLDIGFRNLFRFSLAFSYLALKQEVFFTVNFFKRFVPTFKQSLFFRFIFQKHTF